jgi:hypothetical protein
MSEMLESHDSVFSKIQIVVHYYTSNIMSNLVEGIVVNTNDHKKFNMQDVKPTTTMKFRSLAGTM